MSNNLHCNYPTFDSRWDEDQIHWGLCREACLQDLGHEGSSIASKWQMSQRLLFCQLPFCRIFTTLMATVKKEDLKYMEQSHKTTQAKLRISQTFHPNWRDYILMIVLVCLYWKTHSSSWEGHLIQQTKGLAKKLSGSSSEILLLRKPCFVPWLLPCLHG